MKTIGAAKGEQRPEAEVCLVETVADLMRREPALEAVEIHHDRQSISVATIGQGEAANLERELTDSLRRDRRGAGSTEPHCGLWEGEEGCSSCQRAISAESRNLVTLTHRPTSTVISRLTCPTAPLFWRWRRLALPKFVPRDFELPETAEHLDEWKPQLILAGLCGFFGLGGFMVTTPEWSLTLYALAYLSGAWFAAVEVWERLQKGSIDVHLLMLAVAAGSASIGAWAEGAMLLFLFSFSGALEHYAMGRTQREIQSLFRAAPKTARIMEPDGHERELPVAQLRPGARLLIKPGDQFPVDAEITKGTTAADESNLTGESVPVEKGVGDVVFAGTLNLWGAIEAIMVRPASESALQKIIHLIREAHQHKAPAQRFTDRFSPVYTYVVLGLAFSMFFIWWLGLNLAPFRSANGEASAFYRAMTLLVVSSPCALVLSIPSAVLAAIAWGARRGVLFRGGAAVEKLAEVSVVALDKTGTLTTGELRVERIESFPSGQEPAIGQAAYSLERLSSHPLARAVTRYGKQKGWGAVEFDEFTSLSGLGLRATRAGQQYLLGNRRLFLENPAYRETVRTIAPPPSGFSEVWVAEGSCIGRVLLRDDIRPQAKRVVEALQRDGVRSLVLTGDRLASAETLQQRLQLDDVRAELTPDAKVTAIRQLSADGTYVAMVGDGVNDAPSLASAHVGVAMGSRGSDAALEQAEIILMHDRLENFLAALRVSRKARRVIRQNLVVSLGTVAVLVVLALAGSIPLTVGVIGHEGSTVVVVLNSLRLLFVSMPPEAEQGKNPE